MLISCISSSHLRLLWDPADAHVRPQTFPLWYKSLWRASIISSNNELSLDLTDVSAWMCQRASGLSERRAAAVHHFQGLPVSTGGTWDKPVSARDYIWRLTLDQSHGGWGVGEGNISHADVWPHPQMGKTKRSREERQSEVMRDRQINVRFSQEDFFFYLTSFYIIDKRKGVSY